MSRLFEETSVGSLKLKNRFIRSAVWMKLAEDSGHINDQVIQYYKKLAEGGVGLILTGYAFISSKEQPNPKMLGIYDDSLIDEYKVLVDEVHKAGSKIAMQIVLGGSQTHHPDRDKMVIHGPSPIVNRVTGIKPIEASKEDIKAIIEQFVDAAERVKKAGFDAVQIHAAHGYFLSQFLTPYYNRRTDEYGGSIHNRARIIYETISAIKKRLGDYPLMIKLNFDDFMDEGEGLREEEALEVFKRVDALGVDIIEVSGVNESSGKGIGPAKAGIKTEEESYFKEATKAIAENVNAKVILMGGNRSVSTMEAIFDESSIAYFSIARPLLSEPDLINKWASHKAYKPKCISCNKCWETSPCSCIFDRVK